MSVDVVRDLATCDGCDATVYCSKEELEDKHGWTLLAGVGWKLLLCPECQAKAEG